MAILAMLEHGQDARGTSNPNFDLIVASNEKRPLRNPARSQMPPGILLNARFPAANSC
jgi:hypothetical protein